MQPGDVDALDPTLGGLPIHAVHTPGETCETPMRDPCRNDAAGRENCLADFSRVGAVEDEVAVVGVSSKGRFRPFCAELREGRPRVKFLCSPRVTEEIAKNDQ
jgi:hypothetical protein